MSSLATSLSPLFWSRIHGGTTHFPIALIFSAALFETLGFFFRESPKGRDLSAAGYTLVILAALSSFAAVFTGLAVSEWKIGGTQFLLQHHLFVWPSFALIVALASWRFLVGNSSTRNAFAMYLSGVVIACALIGTAGFFGGEILLSH
jgi:uncharacterized membrane protein